MGWFWRDDSAQLDRIENTLDNVQATLNVTHNVQLQRIERKLNAMAITQDQFDTDLKALTDGITALIAAVEAAIAARPPADLTAEDTAVQEAAAAVADEVAKLAPPA
jgi:hypothetical protein